MVFDHAGAQRGLENDEEEQVVIDALDDDAESPALLVNAAEIRFAEDSGDALGGGERTRRQGRQRGGVHEGGIPDLSDNWAALIDEQHGGRLALIEEKTQRFIECLDVLGL